MPSEPPDPFAVLGLGPTASADDVRKARNRLAKELHPDVGGSAARMQAVNEAAEAALRRIATPSAAQAPRSRAPGRRRTAGATASTTTQTSSAASRRGRVARDHPSFTIEALPAEAFEALLIVGEILGQVADDDPPYRIDMLLDEPRHGWCRVEILPEGGGSSVSLIVAVDGPDAADAVVVDVRDRFLEELNGLDWATDGPRLPPPS